MAASSQPVDNGPTYDLYAFEINNFKKYKIVRRLYLSLRDHPVQDVNFIRDDLKRYSICPDAIRLTLDNPHFLFSKLEPLLRQYEKRYPGDSQLCDIIDEFELIVDSGKFFTLGMLAKLSPQVCQELFKYYGFRRLLTDETKLIYRNSLIQLRDDKFDSKTSILTPSNLREFYLQMRQRFSDFKKMMRDFAIEDIQVPDYTARNLVEYIKAACKLNRLDAINKFFDTHGANFQRPIILSTLKSASWYGNLDIIDYVRQFSGRTRENPLTRVHQILPANVETAELLMTFVDPVTIFSGSLMQGLAEIYDKYNSSVDVENEKKLEYVAMSGNVEFFKFVMKPEDEIPFEVIIKSNCIDLFMYLYETQDIDDTTNGKIFEFLLKNEHYRMLEYFYRKNPKLPLDSVGKFIEDTKSGILRDKMRLANSVKFLTGLIEEDDRAEERQYQEFKDIRNSINLVRERN